MSNRLAELRKEKGLTLDQMQEQTGINRVTISQYERGKREPKLETWKKLADYFDVSIPYLQGVSDYRNFSELGDVLFNSHFDNPNADTIKNNETFQKALTDLRNLLQIENKVEKQEFIKTVIDLMNSSSFGWDFIKIALKTISNDQLTDENKSDLSAVLNDINTALELDNLSETEINALGDKIRSMLVTLLSSKQARRSSPDNQTNKG